MHMHTDTDMDMDAQPTPDVIGALFPGLPSSGDPTVDAVLRDFLRDAVRDFATGRCSLCDAPQGDGTGTLCQRCSDRALLEIACFAGVRGIASDAWDADDYPNAEHPIWGVLQRTLDRRKRGASVEHIYPVLSELQLYETLTVLETDEGQIAFERVTLPFPAMAAERCWLIGWSERYASFLAGTFAGEQRESRLLAAVALLTQRHDRKSAPSALDDDHPFASKVYFRL